MAIARPLRTRKMLKKPWVFKLFQKKWCWRSSFEVGRFSFRRMLQLICLFCLQIPLWPGWLPRGSQGPPWDSLGPPWDFLGTPWDTSWTQKLTFWSEKLGNFENLWKPSGTFEDLRGPSGTFGNPLKPSETAKKIMKHWQIKISRFGQKQKMRNSELGPNL